MRTALLSVGRAGRRAHLRARLRSRLRARVRARRRDEGGYIAVMSVLLLLICLSMAAFAVDVGSWYVTGQENQRAADAASLAGVTYMPGSFDTASATALDMARRNGIVDGDGATRVVPSRVDGQPGRLRVEVTRTVDNVFGGLFGVDSTTITRSAVAAFSGPVPMGSPCNGFGNDPSGDGVRSANCVDTGQFWANVGSPKANKTSGDAYQNGVCSGSDNCTGATNDEYDRNGYFYTVTVKNDLPSLTIQAFDPAFISVGDVCESNFGSGATAAVNAKNDLVYDVGARAYRSGESSTSSGRYAGGATNPNCTGDKLFGSDAEAPDTTFAVRAPTSTTYPWDPTSYAKVTGCTTTFTGYSGALYPKLNQWAQAETSAGSGTYTVPAGAPVESNAYDPVIASEFRRWVPLCTMSDVKAGTYLVQVQTNDPADRTNGNGHNRFALRAFGQSPSQNVDISLAGYTKMAVYANLPSARTEFHLAQVPPSAAGQILNVRLFDIGDSSGSGSITVLPPSDSGMSEFTGCTGSGKVNGSLPGCSITANSSYNGRWQVISVPMPTTYSCTLSSTGCWVRLRYDYGAGNQPSDTTSWQASVDGDPVRLVR